jgi:hypothetical protein
VRVEEAALWYRALDELAFRFVRGHRDVFMDFLQDYLALNLALMGSSPDLINKTMAARTREYAEYRRWVPAENESPAGTLLWEAAKHVGEPVGLRTQRRFLAAFGSRFSNKLDDALIYELLVGRAHA